MQEYKRLHVFLSGLVQGVGMRFFVKNQAESLGLTGFVRNLEDGRVEIIAEGSEKQLKELLKRLENNAVGNITNVELDWEKPAGQYTEFVINR